MNNETINKINALAMDICSQEHQLYNIVRDKWISTKLHNQGDTQWMKFDVNGNFRNTFNEFVQAYKNTQINNDGQAVVRKIEVLKKILREGLTTESDINDIITNIIEMYERFNEFKVSPINLIVKYDKYLTKQQEDND